MSQLDARLGTLLEDRKRKNRFRSLKEYDPSHSGLIDFSSNDYLSLTTSRSLRDAFISRLSASPQIVGSTGSRLLSGGTPAHRQLEDRLAVFFNSPAALLFNSGWDANVSFFSTVPQSEDWVVYDELVHASVHSGLRASRVRPERRIGFTHNYPSSLASVLRRISNEPSGSQQGMVFLALESLYSMDGDMAQLPKLLDVLDEHVPRSRQSVVLDEAHSTGVYGKGGRGIGHALGEEGGWSEREEGGRVGVRLMTFGKAVGSSGAVLLCSPTIRSFLINFARPLIFSTALPHSTLISLECAWDLLQGPEGDLRREALMNLAIYFHALLSPLVLRTPRSILTLPPSSDAPFPSSTSPFLPSNPLSPIIGLLTPAPHALSSFLLARGFIVRPVVPPTVPPGAERVRICLRAEMDKDVVDRLIKALGEWVDKEVRPSTPTPGGGEAPRGLQAVSLKAKL